MTSLLCSKFVSFAGNVRNFMTTGVYSGHEGLEIDRKEKLEGTYFDSCRVGRSASSTHFPYPSSLSLPPFPTFPIPRLYCWTLGNSPWPLVGNPRKRTKVT